MPGEASFAERKIGYLTITTHGVIYVDEGNMPLTTCPYKTTKLNAVAAGVCNYYQQGMPNILPNIMTSVDLSDKPTGADTAEYIKQRLIAFETGGPTTRSGHYLPTMVEDYRHADREDYDPDVQTFFLLGDKRYSINSYEVGSPIIDKTYTVYKSEDKSGPKFENRVLLFLNSSPPIDILSTWRKPGLDGTPANAVQLRYYEEKSITLKEIFDLLLKSDIKLDELVIVDLTCSVLFDKKTRKELTNPGLIRRLRYNALGTRKKRKRKKRKKKKKQSAGTKRRRKSRSRCKK